MSSVSVNPPKTPVTEGSNGIATATIPNVCKMPGPPAPFIPTPLPNIGKSGLSPKDYSKKVEIEGSKVAIKGATFKSMGDIASKGTGGGIVSSNCEGPTSFIGPGSMDVKIEGKNVQLLSDPMLNNCGPSGNPPNAATMVGVLQGPSMIAVLGDEKCPLCEKSHGDKGRLEETKETKDAVEKVKQAIDSARNEANAANSARVAAIDVEISGLRTLAAAALTKKERAPINSRIQELEKERRQLSVELTAMMGAVKGKCDRVYAGTSLVQYRDVLNKLSYHAPNPYHSLTNQPNKGKFSPRRFLKFQEAIPPAHRDKFKDIWRAYKRISKDSAAGKTDEMAYPPGTCAAQQLVLLAMSHSCRPMGLTERWYSSKGAKLSKLRVRDLGDDGVPGPPRFATDEELSGDKPIPPCKTCQVMLEVLMCPDDKGTECAHSTPEKKVCYRC
jgi:hypothetical protein